MKLSSHIISNRQTWKISRIKRFRFDIVYCRIIWTLFKIYSRKSLCCRFVINTIADAFKKCVNIRLVSRCMFGIIYYTEHIVHTELIFHISICQLVYRFRLVTAFYNHLSIRRLKISHYWQGYITVPLCNSLAKQLWTYHLRKLIYALISVSQKHLKPPLDFWLCMMYNKIK